MPTLLEDRPSSYHFFPYQTPIWLSSPTRMKRLRGTLEDIPSNSSVEVENAEREIKRLRIDQPRERSLVPSESSLFPSPSLSSSLPSPITTQSYTNSHQYSTLRLSPIRISTRTQPQQPHLLEQPSDNNNDTDISISQTPTFYDDINRVLHMLHMERFKSSEHSNEPHCEGNNKEEHDEEGMDVEMGQEITEEDSATGRYDQVNAILRDAFLQRQREMIGNR